MKSNEVRNWLPLNLQFFAEKGGATDGNESDADVDIDDGSGEGADDGTGDDEGTEKTFTQTELNSIAAKEKKQGRKAMLKELGFKNETDAKKELEAFKQWKDSQLSEEEKAKLAADEEAGKQQELLDRALKAEQKCAALTAGVRTDSIDDVIAIATVKVTDEKSIDDVLADMKKEVRYASFFQKSDEDDGSKGTGTGTGSSTKHSKADPKATNIGERLGKQKASAVKKSSFFKN